MRAGALLLALLLPATAWAQSSDATAQILGELKAIRQLLEQLVAQGPAGAPAPRLTGPVTLTLQPSDIVMGSPSAPLTMVEFTDLQCPFCRQFHMEAFERIRKTYIETGQVRFVSRDLPLTDLHPLAQSAARVSRCAGDQGKFWEMRHAILVNNNALAAEMFVTFAQDLRLDVARLITCTNDTARIDAVIAADTASAQRVGLAGTPNFVLGRTNGDSLTGETIEGALPFDAFDARIKALLTKP
ncbi:MAG: DsbA family protein [Vicinamibacterales bacterium]